MITEKRHVHLFSPTVLRFIHTTAFCLQRGEEWLEGECSLQCQCMADGFVACSDTECARNEVCRVEEGVKGCFPLNAATCSVYGDPHYITFDGMAYDFQGGCSYTLTTTCGDESSVQFTVIGHNMHPPLGNFTRSKLEAVTLQTDDLNVTLSQSGEVHVSMKTSCNSIQIKQSQIKLFYSKRLKQRL